MADIPEPMLLRGVAVDIAFGEPRPAFGDLHQICGDDHSLFPPEVPLGFERLADLHFEQVDDYFGISNSASVGDDVVIWLYPLANGKPVDHNLGPYDAIRLKFNVLRNPAHRAALFLRCVERFAPLGQSVTYVSRNSNIGNPPDLELIRADMDAIVAHWQAKGIIVGSKKALEVIG